MRVALVGACLAVGGELVGIMAAIEYHVGRSSAPSAALLRADPEAWGNAEAVTFGPERYRTTVRALWDDEALFVTWDVEDDDPWWTLTRRDDPLWEEEVVEIFLDPDRSGTHYAEVEISPANVVCDVRMIAPSPARQMDLDWTLDGLETLVTMRQDPEGRTLGWTATARMPWSGFVGLRSAAKVLIPPRAGDRWRFNVFRIKRPGGPAQPEHGAIYAAWSPPSGASFHEPGAFGDLVFLP